MARSKVRNRQVKEGDITPDRLKSQNLPSSTEKYLAYYGSLDRFEWKDLAGLQSEVVPDGNILVIYDPNRLKNLSIQRMFLGFGRSGLTTSQYLGFFGSNTFPSNRSGFRMARNATLCSLSVQLEAAGSGTFYLIKNDLVATPVTLISLSSELGVHDNTLDIDLNEGDYLQCSVDTPTSVDSPVILIEIAWRF